jgi:hypothetical protein
MEALLSERFNVLFLCRTRREATDSKNSRCFAFATSAHPFSGGNGDRS